MEDFLNRKVVYLTEERNNSGVDWLSLILGIIFILVAIYSYNNPATSLTAIAIYLGIVIMVKGIFSLIGAYQLNKLNSNFTVWPIVVLGVLEIIIGFMIFNNLVISILSLPTLFAIWFIISSIFDLISSQRYEKFGSGVKGLHIFADILGIILGILMIVNPLSSYITVVFIVATYFLINGIMYVVNAFTSH